MFCFQSLAEIIAAVSDGGATTAGAEHRKTAVTAILSATERLKERLGNAPEMVGQAKMVAKSAQLLINMLKDDAANEKDRVAQQKLIHAARQVGR